MLAEPKCHKRRCKNYVGTLSDGVEVNERHQCLAFPEEIPDSIAYGSNKHLKPVRGQINQIVFEKE